jgi:hypothetical protein
MEYYGEDALPGQNPNTEKDTIYYAAEQKENQLRSLLAELGGDSPQNRAIAEGLQNQGIGSTKDIGVRKVTVPGGVSGSDESFYQAPDTIENAYFNKATGQEIDPNRLGIIQNGQAGVEDGDIFFHLNADENGNIGFTPQWSPRAHGFLRDNSVGQAIMAIGKIIPVTSPFFLGASAIDAAAHGNWGAAAANLLPMGIKELATASNLADLAGNADFVSTAKTAAGKIAEAAGAPSAYADAFGKAGVATLRSGLTGNDLGKSLLMSQLPSPGSFVRDAGDFSRGIAGFDVGDTSEFDADALKGINGWNSWEGGDNYSGLASLTPEGLQALYNQENPGAANVDVETANTVRIDGKEYFLNNQGGASVQNPDGSYTNLNAREFADLGEPDEVASDAALDTVTVRPNEEYKLNNDPDYVTPFGQGMVDDTWTTEGIPETPPTEPPKVPPIFSPKAPSEPVKPKADLSGLLSLLAIGTALNQPKIDAKFENFQAPTDLKGGYSFDWNAQPFKQPEGGNAYSQDYYGQHWNKNMAEGGITALPFTPTMNDGGVKAEDLLHDDVTNQVIQHMRGGGHVMDDKTHSAVKYLASKGEPVHHIVGFMKHRMAGGGLTSLGSYSDGGHLLKGPGDGMSDDIPATIADKQPARLANEEFVIPADVVSHLGNGSSESGAKVLYDMMAKVRKARTGNPKQGKQIDAHKFMPKV